jgi:hypothetical protein
MRKRKAASGRGRIDNEKKHLMRRTSSHAETSSSGFEPYGGSNGRLMRI